MVKRHCVWCKHRYIHEHWSEYEPFVSLECKYYINLHNPNKCVYYEEED